MGYKVMPDGSITVDTEDEAIKLAKRIAELNQVSTSNGWAKTDLRCNVGSCDFVAKSTQGLGRHKYAIHGEGGHRSKQATDEDRKSQDKVRNLAKRGAPAGELEFDCDEHGCKRSFSRQNGLTRHKRRSHRTPKKKGRSLTR